VESDDVVQLSQQFAELGRELHGPGDDQAACSGWCNSPSNTSTRAPEPASPTSAADAGPACRRRSGRRPGRQPAIPAQRATVPGLGPTRHQLPALRRRHRHPLAPLQRRTNGTHPLPQRAVPTTAGRRSRRTKPLRRPARRIHRRPTSTPPPSSPRTSPHSSPCTKPKTTPPTCTPRCKPTAKSAPRYSWPTTRSPSQPRSSCYAPQARPCTANSATSLPNRRNRNPARPALPPPAALAAAQQPNNRNPHNQCHHPRRASNPPQPISQAIWHAHRPQRAGSTAKPSTSPRRRP
jgi:hypothetical protein